MSPGVDAEPPARSALFLRIISRVSCLPIFLYTNVAFSRLHYLYRPSTPFPLFSRSPSVFLSSFFPIFHLARDKSSQKPDGVLVWLGLAIPWTGRNFDGQLLGMGRPSLVIGSPGRPITANHKGDSLPPFLPWNVQREKR